MPRGRREGPYDDGSYAYVLSQNGYSRTLSIDKHRHWAGYTLSPVGDSRNRAHWTAWWTKIARRLGPPTVVAVSPYEGDLDGAPRFGEYEGMAVPFRTVVGDQIRSDMTAIWAWGRDDFADEVRRTAPESRCSARTVLKLSYYGPTREAGGRNEPATVVLSFENLLADVDGC